MDTATIEHQVGMAFLRAGIAIITGFALVVSFRIVLPWGLAWRRVVLVALTAAILLLPLMVPYEYPIHRAAVVLVGVFMALKLYDAHYATRIEPPPSWPTYVAFAVHPFTVVRRKLVDEARPSLRQNLFPLARNVAIGLISLAASVRVWRLDFTEVPFVVEHVLKTVVFMALVYGVTETSTVVWRLPGWRARAHLHNFFLARTPADFWRRYSRVIGQFLYEDVYKQVGGRRSPVGATLMVFAISGLIHEYAFGIVAERLQGYQMVFFMVQGAAVAATQRIKPRGPRAVLWTVATMAFNLTTSVFFFASLNQVWPYWSANAPAFLLR